MSQTVVRNLRAVCPCCRQTVCVTNSGLLYRHRDGRKYCIASRKTPAQADARHTWIAFLHRHFQIGDAIPVNNAMLNTNPPASLLAQVTYTAPEIPDGLDLDDELKILVNHARGYIVRMRDLLIETDWNL